MFGVELPWVTVGYHGLPLGYRGVSPEREDELQGEVVAAISAVRRLEAFLKGIRQSELASHPIPHSQRSFSWLIEDAITSRLPSQKEEALRALKHACEAFLLEEVRARGITVKLDESPDIWGILFRSGTLARGEMRALSSSRDYFTGKVAEAEFSEIKFNEAANVLLRARLRALLKKGPTRQT